MTVTVSLDTDATLIFCAIEAARHNLDLDEFQDFAEEVRALPDMGIKLVNDVHDKDTIRFRAVPSDGLRAVFQKYGVAT